MTALERVSEFIGRWMAVVVVIVAVFSLAVPNIFGWIKTGWVNYLLRIAMFGMGLTLQASDFKEIARHPM